MDSEKAFWALIALVVVGMFGFLIFGSFATPVNAAPQQPLAYGAQATGGQAAAAGNQQAALLGAPAQAGGQQAGGTLAPTNSGVQEVTISVQGSTYYPNPIRVKKGIPVRITADIANMPGCSKSVVMPDFGIRKVVSASDNIIEFTPTQSGTFSFSCSMNMYRGTIIVEEADGTVAANTGSAPKAAVGSCGGSSGGCGCGG